MTTKPRLIPAVICFIAASFSWYFWGEYMPGEVATLILVGAGGLYGLNWILREIISRVGEWRKANNVEYLNLTADRDRMIAASKLTAEQIAALDRQGVRIALQPGGRGEPPKRYVVLADRWISDDFVITFLAAGTPEYLAPIRTWGEGSNERADAEALTAYFIEFRFAEPAKGPRPAKWLDRAGGLRSIGLEED